MIRDKYVLVFIDEIRIWYTPKWDRVPAVIPFSTLQANENWPYIFLESKDWKGPVPRYLEIYKYRQIAEKMFENLSDKELEMKFLALQLKGK